MQAEILVYTALLTKLVAGSTSRSVAETLAPSRSSSTIPTLHPIKLSASNADQEINYFRMNDRGLRKEFTAEIRLLAHRC